MDKSKCIIISPVLHDQCDKNDRAIAELNKRGYGFMRSFGKAYIDKIRSMQASIALRRGFDEIMWIDCDIVFNPDDVDKLRAHNLPIVSGLYAIKDQKEGGIAAYFPASVDEITFGAEGGLMPVTWNATGFMHTRREVYERIEATCGLRHCIDLDHGEYFPYFYTMLKPNGSRDQYLGEDLSFCERAIEAGFEIYADTSIRLWHEGTYLYGWEDMVGDRQRAETFRVQHRPKYGVYKARETADVATP